MTEELLFHLRLDFDNDDNGRFWATHRQTETEKRLIRLMERENAADGVSANDQAIIRASGRKDAKKQQQWNPSITRC